MIIILTGSHLDFFQLVKNYSNFTPIMDFILESRVLASKDWATVLFVLCLIIIAVTKTFFESKFNDFIKIIINDKYLKIYRDKSDMLSWFTISLFVVQLISFSFLILLVLDTAGFAEKTNGIRFIQILTFLSFFTLSKYLIEKIVAASFKIEDFTDLFNLHKIGYRTLTGILIFPLTIILFYNTLESKWPIYLLTGIAIILNAFTYFKTLKQFQSILISKLFYFILYLCALEIAPYYFMYYWFTKR